MKERESSCTVGGNIVWCCHDGHDLATEPPSPPWETAQTRVAPDPAPPLLSTYMEESSSKRYMSLKVHRSQDLEDTRPLRDGQVKTWCVYMMEYCSAIKVEGNNATCINIDKFRLYHTK